MAHMKMDKRPLVPDFDSNDRWPIAFPTCKVDTSHLTAFVEQRLSSRRIESLMPQRIFGVTNNSHITEISEVQGYMAQKVE